MHLSLFPVFLSGLVGGFAATLMPCIFPMLPLTVSYFTKNAESKSRGVNRAFVYGLFIIMIYVVLGLLITVLFGADALNSLATNGIFNFLFFLLLVVFAASFLGAFDIMLPTPWINKVDKNADKSGIVGLFFMAGTLALVSFSCTGPIIGTLLVQAATNGKLLAPAAGMFGFSLALALPFMLFALFPHKLSTLPRSGKWLNNVKVMLGFLELAFSLKFLSNVDLVYHLNLFDREIFLVLWITIFALMGFYILGKLRFAYDDAVKHINLTRLSIAIAAFSFSLYMIPGLWGAPLRSIAAFLPPQQTQDFDLYTPRLNSTTNAVMQTTKKYDHIFHSPLGLNAFFDFEEGRAFAQKVNKPILVDFTGHACVNCRKMEATIWPDKKVLSKINDSYILIQLYVDDKTPLPQNEQYISKFSGRRIENLGQKWSDLQESKFNSNSQPFYVTLDNNGKLLQSPEGADYDAASYAHFLDNGIKVFTNNTARGSL